MIERQTDPIQACYLKSEGNKKKDRYNGGNARIE